MIRMGGKLHDDLSMCVDLKSSEKYFTSTGPSHDYPEETQY